MTYKEAEQYLLEIPKFTKKNPLENTQAFMQCLGEMFPYDAAEQEKRPWMRDLNNVIHVAGTNGKGSVCAFLNGILTEAGYKTGMFTSPHLISMTERFRMDGEPVCEEVFTNAFARVKACVEQGTADGIFAHPTFFEWLVGMAYLIFTDEKVDVIILETGLGGRLDATNLVEKPLACVITSIGFDHTEFLGNTLEQIAMEKAGIIKEGVPVIYEAGNPCVNAVIEQKACQRKAKTYPMDMGKCEILYFDKKHIDFLFQSEYYNNMRINLETSAVYQILNAALAVLTIEYIDKAHRIPEEIIQEGIRKTRWPGRMEWLEEHFLIDGAHNENGMQQALCSLEKMEKKVILIYAAVKDKNYPQIIRMLCEKLTLECVVVTQMDTHRSVVTEKSAGLFREHFTGSIYEEKCVENAVLRAEQVWQNVHTEEERQQEDRDCIIFGTGSLYLVGALKAFYMEQES